ncbi:MAG TPA: glycosyltransferase [Thermoanaerobaculia bacterium]|jgi:glycosyltransferase involved in cell wall biosynthesis
MQVGLVSPTTGSSWLGGLYITQNLVLATTLLPPSERPLFRDLYWGSPPVTDPWIDIRSQLGPPAVVQLPRTLAGRARRAFRRGRRDGTMRDLFEAAGIDVMLPVRVVDKAGVPLIFHLPDFQHRYLPQINDQRVREEFERRFEDEARAATLVHVSSQSIRDDVERFLPEILPKVRLVFPVSIPTPLWYEREPMPVARRLRLPERYLVIPNMVAAHKNHLSIARALAILKQRGIKAHVVCTGKTGDYRDVSFFQRLTREIETLGVTSRIHFTGVLERTDQMAVIRRSVAVIQPSLFEGWGAAVAEAKALGKPLLASDLPVNHEHAPGDVQWIAPLEAGTWADAMAELLATRSPGPDLAAEEAARTRVLREGVEVGRAFVALLREVA